MAGTDRGSTGAAAVTFSGDMLSRGIAEGLIDSNRGPTKTDVGQSRRSLASDLDARFGSRQVIRVAIRFDLTGWVFRLCLSWL